MKIFQPAYMSFAFDFLFFFRLLEQKSLFSQRKSTKKEEKIKLEEFPLMEKKPYIATYLLTKTRNGNL